MPHTYLSAMAVVAVLALLGTDPIYGQTSLDNQLHRQKEELKELERKLNVEKSALDSLAKKRTNVVQEVEQIQENLKLNQEYLGKMDSVSTTISLSLKEVEKNLGRVQAKIEDNNKLMSHRVRTLYLTGKHNFWSSLLTPGSQNEFFKKVFFTRRLLEYDKALIATAVKNRELEKAALEKLQARLEENQKFKYKKSEETKRLSKSQKEMEKNISSLEQDENRRRAALKKMEQNSKNLLALINKLEEQRKKEKKEGTVKVLAKKGKFCFPSAGEVVSKFGLQYHSTLKTQTKNLGVEFLSPGGKSVLSAAEGDVVYVNEIPGYGRGVILYNGSGYYTIYGNLQEIKVKEGDKVQGCQELADVPTSASRLARKVYFEVRQERTSVDPVKWLKSKID